MPGACLRPGAYEAFTLAGQAAAAPGDRLLRRRKLQVTVGEPEVGFHSPLILGPRQVLRLLRRPLLPPPQKMMYWMFLMFMC